MSSPVQSRNASVFMSDVLYYSSLAVRVPFVSLKQCVSILWNGPLRPTRDWKMEIFASISREIASHPRNTVERSRKALEFFQIDPKVRERLLKGIQIEKIELNVGGENGIQVTGVDEVTQLNDERVLTVYSMVPEQLSTDKVILFFHGGAYFLSSAKRYVPWIAKFVKKFGAQFYSVEYRLAPEFVYPAALHDAVASYTYLTQELQIPSDKIVLMGDSAGGNLALATLLFLRDHQYPMPGGVIALSPWTDLSHTCESWVQNSIHDYIAPFDSHPTMNPVKFFTGKDDYKDFVRKNPYISPMFSTPSDLSPILLITGADECLLDENVGFAYKCAKSKSTFIQHDIYDHQLHVFPLIAPTSKATSFAIQSMIDFLRDVVGTSKPGNGKSIVRLVAPEGKVIKEGHEVWECSLPRLKALL